MDGDSLRSARYCRTLLWLLVDLLEFCFKNSKNYVRLEREIEFLQNYSKIQNIRNGRQIQVEFDIPLELKKAVY